MNLKDFCMNSPGFLDHLLASMEEVVIIADLEGRVKFSNEASKCVLGFSPEELEGRSLDRIFTAEDLACLYPNLLAMARKYEPFDGELMLIRGDGDRFFAFVTLRTFDSAKSDMTMFSMQIRDIDEKKRLRGSAGSIGRDDLIRVAGGIAHELRNPLVVIGGFARRLYASSRGSGDLDRYHNFIEENLRKIETVIKKAEFFANLPAPHFKQASIGDIVAVAAGRYRGEMEKRSIELSEEIGDFRLFVDADLLQTAFAILFENALDALPDGARVDISAAAHEETVDVLMTNKGQGIPPEDLPHLFTPFFNTGVRGAGIDLATVRRILDVHGGAIEVSSEPASGTTFRLRFPLERRRAIRLRPLKPCDGNTGPKTVKSGPPRAGKEASAKPFSWPSPDGKAPGPG